MFGDDEFEDLVEELLASFTLDEILEMNNLSDEDVLKILIREGQIGEPEHVIEEFSSKSIED